MTKSNTGRFCVEDVRRMVISILCPAASELASAQFNMRFIPHVDPFLLLTNLRVIVVYPAP